MPARLTKIVNGVRRFVSRNGRRATTGCKGQCCTSEFCGDHVPDPFCENVQGNQSGSTVYECHLLPDVQLTLNDAALVYTGNPNDLDLFTEIRLLSPVVNMPRTVGTTPGAGGGFFAGPVPCVVTPVEGEPYVANFCVSVSDNFNNNTVSVRFGGAYRSACATDIVPVTPVSQRGGYLAAVRSFGGGQSFVDAGICSGSWGIDARLGIDPFTNFAAEAIPVEGSDCNPVNPPQPLPRLGVGSGLWKLTASFSVGAPLPAGDCSGSGAIGPCCYGNGLCTTTTVAQCDSLGGAWLGEGHECQECPPPVTGACCSTRSTVGGTQTVCSERTRASCNLSRGQYRGDNTTCTSSPCPPLEACCIGNNRCVDATEYACRVQLRGTPQGPGTRCATSSCGGTDGACCINGNCVKATASDCIANGGTYQGDGTDCAGVSCPPQVGSCCVPGNPPECFNVTFQACQDKLGSWAPGTCANRVCVGINPASTSLDILRGFVSS